MRTTESAVADTWRPYQPTKARPWDLRRVHRLHRRAGFGASWSELQRDVRRGPEDSVDAVLRGGKPRTDGFEERQKRLAEIAAGSRRPERLQAWWVYRMLYGGHPLRERLTLMWHDHFATSQQKVNNLSMMWRQNEIFRRHALAHFDVLLPAVVKDPALLVFLDATSNKKGRINENLGRELFELFTLGIGHYNQHDVVAASRALTGWGVDEHEAFAFREADHDRDPKTILGQTGNFDGDQLLKLTLAHDATAQTIAMRLCDEFMGENTPVDAVSDLAQGLRDNSMSIRWAVETILRSERFHCDDSCGIRFVGPAEYVISAVRALEVDTHFPSTLEIASWITRAGQKLFFPPNVGGWPAGRSWFTQRGVLTRANFADALVQGRVRGVPKPLDLHGRMRERGAATRSDGTSMLCRLLLGCEGVDWLPSDVASSEPWTPRDARKLATLILSSPDAQLM